MLAMLLLAAVAQGARAKVWTFNGDGTDTNPYRITSVEEWNHLAENVNNNSKTYEGEFFKLFNDIKFTDSSNCQPIGTYVSGTSGTNNKPFKGTFDGNGYTISDFTINNGTYQGLFGYIGNGGTVKNIIINGLNINVTGNSGAIAGRNEGTIEGIIVSNSIIKVLNNAVGGIVGNNYAGGKVQNCHILNDVTIGCTGNGNATKCGGIIGNNSGSNVLNCSNKHQL